MGSRLCRQLHLALALAAVIAIAVPALATDLEVAAMPGAVPGPPAATDGVLTLNLSGAYEVALSRNLTLQVGRVDLAWADAGIVGSSGFFDPNLTASLSSSSDESPTVSQLEGAEVVKSQGESLNLGLNQILPTGGQVSVTLSERRSETNSQFVFLNPSWYTDLNLSLRQPLLEGFGTTVTRAGIVIAKNSRAQTATAFEGQVVATLRQVEVAYWDYIRAREAVAVNEQSLALAERLLNETRERVEVGTSAPIDTVQSEAGVATRRQDLIVARNSADNAEDTLKAVLGFDRPEEWLTRIAAAEPIATAVVDVDLAQAITAALARRPELRQLEIGLDTSDLRIELARNDRLPSLDLQAAYGYSGIGGTVNDTTLPTAKSGLSDSFGQIGDFPGWSVGLSFTMPLGNTAADAALAQRRFERDRAEVDLAALRQQIIHEVRVAVRALHDGAAAIDAAVASRQFATRNLEAEQTKFANGLSTNYQVLEIQEDLAQAELSELNARTVYRRAIVGYMAATGTLLEQRGIAIIDPGAAEEPHQLWKDIRWMQFVDFTNDEVTNAENPGSEG